MLFSGIFSPYTRETLQGKGTDKREKLLPARISELKFQFTEEKVDSTTTEETLLFSFFRELRPLWCTPFFPDLWCIHAP